MAILTVVTGIVFILLLLSLLATTVMELIASFFQLRGKNLLKALQNMLASCDATETVLKDFQSNSLYRHLTQHFGRRNQAPPSYMSAESFQSILFDIILKGEGYDKLKERIDLLPDDDLRNVLNQLLREANHELDDFKLKVRGWYDNVMDRASGWYKRYTQKVLIGLGLFIAIIFNADTIAIYQRLGSNPELLQDISQAAAAFAQSREEVDAPNLDANFEEVLVDLRMLLDHEIESIRTPLGLGWDPAMVMTLGPWEWVSKILGFIVTALAISLGAPFWFDLLRKFVNIRASGDKPSQP